MTMSTSAGTTHSIFFLKINAKCQCSRDNVKIGHLMKDGAFGIIFEWH